MALLHFPYFTTQHFRFPWKGILIGIVVGTFSVVMAAERSAVTKTTPYFEIVQRSVDTLLENALDTAGEQRSGMILSVLDRKTGRPLTTLPKAPSGVRKGDRTGPGGSNANLQQDLYRVLDHLSRVTGDKRYAEASRLAVLDFARITQSPVTGFFAWGEHLYWNCLEDRLGDLDPNGTHEPKRKFITYPLLLKEDPERALRYARGLWDHQIADKVTGEFSRHAKYAKHAPGRGYDFAKEGGFFIDTWSQAYAQSRDDVFREAVAVLARRYLGKMNQRNLMNFDSTNQPGRVNLCWTEWMVALATECHDAAQRMDPVTADLLRTLADRQDQGFLGLEHAPDDSNRGFIMLAFTDSGKVRPDEPRKTTGYSQPWGLGYGLNTSAMFALLANTRQAQLGDGPKGDAYRRLLLETAAIYQRTPPDPLKNDLWAGEYGMAIMVELAAYRLTGKADYLSSARTIADAALIAFWGNDGRLPRASTQADYYDVISYADTLLLALLALHEQVTGKSLEVPLSDLIR
ncbi:MAG TPA: hypothetical protein PLN52_17930 [Opitutaceae bacterium]|nr:hypothetical protein [Opitutaceae bacterium]